MYFIIYRAKLAYSMVQTIETPYFAVKSTNFVQDKVSRETNRKLDFCT